MSSKNGAEYMRKWRERQGPEAVHDYNRKWNQRRRALLLATIGPEGLKERNRQHYLRYGSYVRRDRELRIKTEAIQLYGGRCNCCGESEIAFLSLDHIKPVGNVKMRKAGGSFYTFHRNGMARDPNIQVLCYNCNFAKRNGPCCPHLLDALLSA